MAVTDERRDAMARRWYPLAWAVVSVALFGVAWLVLVPTDPTGGLQLGAVDPDAGMSAADLGRIDTFGAWMTPLRIASIAVSLLTVLVLGMTGLGARLAQWVGRPIRLRPLRVLVVAGAVVSIGWALALPIDALHEVVRNQAGSISGGWAGWARRELTELVRWWAFASVPGLIIWVAMKLLPRVWWLVLSLAAGLVVVAGSIGWSHLSGPDTNRPSLPDGPLRSHVLALADELGVDVDDVQVEPETPTTTIYNAYVDGVGDQQVIVVYETMLNRSTPEEVEFVVAHELGHVAADDSTRRALLTGFAVMAGVGLVGALLTSARVRRRAGLSGHRGVSSTAAVPLVVAGMAAALALASPVLKAADRDIEIRADLTALEVTDDPAALVGVVQRSALLSLDDPYPPWAERLSSSHPSTAERIALAAAWESAGESLRRAVRESVRDTADPAGCWSGYSQELEAPPSSSCSHGVPRVPEVT